MGMGVFRFIIAAFPGFLLALRWVSSGTATWPVRLPEGNSGAGNILGLARNPAYWTVTLGMAAGVFTGRIQYGWRPFLSGRAGYTLDRRS